MTHDDLLFHTTAWANRVRTMLDAPALQTLPAGIPGDDYIHPVCQAMPCGAVLGRDTLLLVRYDIDVALPEEVLSFCERFDDWQYPELIDWTVVAEALTADWSELGAELEELARELFEDLDE